MRSTVETPWSTWNRLCHGPTQPCGDSRRRPRSTLRPPAPHLGPGDESHQPEWRDCADFFVPDRLYSAGKLGLMSAHPQVGTISDPGRDKAVGDDRNRG